MINAIEHAFVLCPDRQIYISDLPVEIIKPEADPIGVEKKETPSDVKKVRKVHSLNKDKLVDLLHDCDWNKAEVARQVGLSRASIWKYMKKWNIPMQT